MPFLCSFSRTCPGRQPANILAGRNTMGAMFAEFDCIRGHNARCIGRFPFSVGGRLLAWSATDEVRARRPHLLGPGQKRYAWRVLECSVHGYKMFARVKQMRQIEQTLVICVRKVQNTVKLQRRSSEELYAPLKRTLLASDCDRSAKIVAAPTATSRRPLI